MAGYAGDSDSVRQAGSRAAKSTAVMNLLAMASAEAGGGDTGVVNGAEAKRILSRLARGSDPSVRIRAIEGLGKLEAAEQAANRQDEPTEPNAVFRHIVCDIPVLGPAIAVGMWFNHAGFISGFPFLETVAPYLATHFPGDWARWRGTEPDARLDRMAAGPVLTPDQIAAALKSPAPKLNGTRHSAPAEQEAASVGA
jgi:hypothetical protein